MSNEANGQENPDVRREWKVVGAFAPGMTAVMPVIDSPATKAAALAYRADDDLSDEEYHDLTEWQRRLAEPYKYMP